MAVYLDYNATTPVDPDVQDTIIETLKNEWGNPSSSYSLGTHAKEAIEDARFQVANMIWASPGNIVFTSGGTESNMMVIQTVIKRFYEEKINAPNYTESLPHIITSNIEHDSIKLPLEELKNQEKIDVTFVPVSKVTGAIEVDDILNQVKPSTCLITLMLANNETGVIQPINLLKDKLSALKRKNSHTIYLHTDAAQAIGKLPVDISELDVDYLTIVGHKFYGPRIGALYFKTNSPLYPIFYGGGQEKSYRPGTENTCMIAGLGRAAELVSKNLNEYIHTMSSMKEYLEKRLKETFKEKVIFNCKSICPMLPNTLSVAFNYNVNGKALLATSGICASTGAACHSSQKSSPILIASGVPANLASKTLRLSVGRETTKEDIDVAVKKLRDAINSLSK
ncbi:selenocysteine lyase-like [Uloborus diversus]|uniref:selenocysteine lyase-like n=1 Tax=Uloborus diversus TaxID=327109 RepID=UPI00240A37FB|nr:selenocysteine lyase-like [Uloborus diversus]